MSDDAIAPPRSAKALRFPAEYLKDLNGTQAAIRAGFAPRSAPKQGWELLRHPWIQTEVARLQVERAQRVEVDADMVLERLWDLANADPNELIEFRRTCCRYCHGAGHGYQRTAVEHARRIGQPGDTIEPRDEGGIGFDARLPPHPNCPECFGEGIERPFPRDTRDLSRAARRLYAGVKVTRHGLEVKMHDQLAALMAVGKHLGMFKDVVEHHDASLEQLIREDADAERAARGE